MWCHVSDQTMSDDDDQNDDGGYDRKPIDKDDDPD